MNEKITRAPLKKAAKKVIRGHYWLLVVTCLFAALLGTAFEGSFVLLNLTNYFKTGDATAAVTSVASADLADVISSVIDGTMNNYIEKSEDIEQTDRKEGLDVLGIFTLQSRKGILSAVVNKMNSGGLFVLLYTAIMNMTKSTKFTSILFIIISFLIYGAFWAFLTNVYKVIYSRIFLEARTYKNVPVSRFLYLFRVRRYLKAVRSMLLVFVFEFLWSLTIVGGIIKHYSYILVPYIVAENPDISPLDAVTLSRKMMNGHKWEWFVLDLSFIPWELLNALTLGLLRIFFLNSYTTATESEYYAAIRGNFKGTDDPMAANLNDRYLYEIPSDDVINEAYADLIGAAAEPDTDSYLKAHKVKIFFARWFGIVLSYNNQEDRDYRAHQIRKHKIERLKKIQAKELYPTRLFAIPEKEKNEDLQDLGYYRAYSITSLIMIFFALALVGWLWEVTLHILKGEGFINRGALHGPWLPIYGAGSVMILLLLRRLRQKPWLEFIAAIVLCGVVEYFTHLYLQVSLGKEWWDYSGYLLNLNGRICAEGLLVFGLGGFAVVYLLAPFLDNLYRKIPAKIMIPVCALLVAVFAADCVYSHFVPNEGKGITDYDSSKNESDDGTELFSEIDPPVYKVNI